MALTALALLAAVPVPAAVAAAERPDGTVERVVRDPRILEDSALAPSVLHPDVLWTLNDSDNPAMLFAVRRDGRVGAALRVQGFENRDWEALAAFRDGSGTAVLAVGDVGDNGGRRADVRIALFAEPTRLADATVRPLRVLTLRYPDGAHDAETILVDPRTRRLYVVTKGLISSTVYAVPPALWAGSARGGPARATGTLVPVASLPVVLATDGVVAPDGSVLVRGYGTLARFPPLERAAGGERDTGALGVQRLPPQEQGEGLALAADGRSVLVSSEGRDQPVLRVPLDPDLRVDRTPGTPAPSPSRPGASAAPGARAGAGAPAATADGATADGATSRRSTVAALVLGGAVAAALALGLARRRRGSGR